MTHNKNGRNMLKVGLIGIALLTGLSIACDISGEIDGKEIQSVIDTAEEVIPQSLGDWGNDAADAIDQWAEDAGIPNSLPGAISTEIVDWREEVHDKDFFK